LNEVLCHHIWRHSLLRLLVKLAKSFLRQLDLIADWKFFILHLLQLFEIDRGGLLVLLKEVNLLVALLCRVESLLREFVIRLVYGLVGHILLLTHQSAH